MDPKSIDQTVSTSDNPAPRVPKRGRRHRSKGRRQHNRFHATKKTLQEHVRLLNQLQDSLCGAFKVSVVRHDYPPQLTQDIRMPPHRPLGNQGVLQNYELWLANSTTEAERKKHADSIRKHLQKVAARESQYKSLVEIQQTHQAIRQIIHDCHWLVAKCPLSETEGGDQ